MPSPFCERTKAPIFLGSFPRTLPRSSTFHWRPDRLARFSRPQTATDLPIRSRRGTDPDPWRLGIPQVRREANLLAHRQALAGSRSRRATDDGERASPRASASAVERRWNAGPNGGEEDPVTDVGKVTGLKGQSKAATFTRAGCPSQTWCMEAHPMFCQRCEL